MSHQSGTVFLPADVVQVQLNLPPAEAPMLMADTAQPLTPEQLRAVEAAFAQQQHEADLAFGLVGMWTSTALLRDLAIEHFDEEEEISVPRERGKQKPEEDEDEES
jgi:hypothetical protein